MPQSSIFCLFSQAVSFNIVYFLNFVNNIYVCKICVLLKLLKFSHFLKMFFSFFWEVSQSSPGRVESSLHILRYAVKSMFGNSNVMFDSSIAHQWQTYSLEYLFDVSQFTEFQYTRLYLFFYSKSEGVASAISFAISFVLR